MAEKVGSIFFQVTVDNAQAKKDLKETSTHLDKAGQSAHKTSKLTNTLKLGMVGAAAAAIAFGKSSVKAYFESEQAHTKLVTNLKVLKTNTDANAASLEKLASKMQNVGVIEDDVIIAGMSQLATFKLQSKTIEQLTPKIGDMVAQLKGHNATAEDTVGINNLIGKAMTGSTGALSKYGITMDANQKKIIQTGTESEKAAILVDVLSQNYGKVNEALGKTPQGKITQLKNAFGDLQESVGKALVDVALPAMEALGGSSGSAMEVIKGLVETIGKVAGSTIKGLTPVLEVVKPLIPLLKGLSTVAGAIPPTFIQLALGGALLSRALDRITLDTKSATSSLRDHVKETSGAVPKHASFARSLTTTGSNFQNIGLHARNMVQTVKEGASHFGDSMSAMGSKAKLAGANIVNALGGPMGIGLMVGTLAISKIVGSINSANASAKALKKEAVDTAKELRFSTVSKSSTAHVVEILDALVQKGGEASKAIKALAKDSTSSLAQLVSDRSAYDSRMATLKDKAGGVGDKNIAGSIGRTLGNVLGGADEEKNADRKATALKKVRNAVVETQRDILKSNQELSRSMGREDLAKVFKKQADVVEKDVGKAYMGAAKATAELNRQQARITDSAERVALGLDKASKSTSKNSEAMIQGAADATKLLAKLSDIADSTQKVTAEAAIANENPALLAKESQRYIALAKTNVDEANAYALQVAESMGVSPEEADKIAQSLIDLDNKTMTAYRTLMTDVKSNLVPMDKALSEKMEIKPGGPTEQTLLANVRTLNKMNTDYVKNIQIIYDAGFTNIAEYLKAHSAEEAGATAAAIVSNIGSANKTLTEALNAEITSGTDTITRNINTQADALEAAYRNRPISMFPSVVIKPTIKTEAIPAYSLTGWMDGKKTASSLLNLSFMPVEQKALGGPVGKGKPYLVGEEGPELYVPDGNGTIMTAGQTSRMLGQASSGLSSAMGNTYISVDASGIMATSQAHKRAVISDLVEALNEELIGRGITPLADNKVHAA